MGTPWYKKEINRENIKAFVGFAIKVGPGLWNWFKKKRDAKYLCSGCPHTECVFGADWTFGQVINCPEKRKK